MRQYQSTILIFLCTLCAGFSFAEETVPRPAGSRYPNIKASLNDGFFVLAEQQTRGVLRSEPKEAEGREAALLLAHALWGQKRYSEMLDVLRAYNGEAGFVYWRARAHFELRQYDAALRIFAEAGGSLAGSRYAPSSLRLKGHIEQLTGTLDDAVATYLQFSEEFPKHR